LGIPQEARRERNVENPKSGDSGNFSAASAEAKAKTAAGTSLLTVY
jgi:hypothetical protein